MSVVEHLGPRVRQLRESLELTQAELGKRVGVTAASISMIEHSHSIPSLKMLERLSGALYVQPSTLLEDDKTVAIAMPETPISDLSAQEFNKLVRESDKDEINRLLWQIDVEMRRLIDVVEGPVFSALRRTRLYQATLTQRWVDMCDTSRDRESNTVKTLADVAAELGVGYLEHADSETDEALGEKLA